MHYGNGEVGFIGWDRYRRRYLSVWQHQHAGGPVQLAPHGDPGVPPVLPGESNDVVLCSDGVTALRALADAERSGRAMPTVIALYGQRPDKILLALPGEIQDVIARADHVGTFGTVGSRELHAAFEAIRASRNADPMAPERLNRPGRSGARTTTPPPVVRAGASPNRRRGRLVPLWPRSSRNPPTFGGRACGDPPRPPSEGGRGGFGVAQATPIHCDMTRLSMCRVATFGVVWSGPPPTRSSFGAATYPMAPKPMGPSGMARSAPAGCAPAGRC